MTSLRRRMVEDMQIRNLAVNTQKSYIQQVSLFAQHFQKSPELLGPEHIRAYQVYLTNEKKLSTGSITIAISALRFLYRVTLKKDWSFADLIPAPKVPKKLPIILSPEEVVQFLDCVRARKHRAILTTCYAAGLRISEAVALTPPTVDSKRMVIRVEKGKGRRDRYVMLSEWQACHSESNEKERIMRRRWPGPAFVGAQLKSTFSLFRWASERVEPG